MSIQDLKKVASPAFIYQAEQKNTTIRSGFLKVSLHLLMCRDSHGREG